MPALNSADVQDILGSPSELAKVLFQQAQDCPRFLRPGVSATDVARVLAAETFEEFEGARKELLAKLWGPPKEQRRHTLAQEAFLRHVIIEKVELKELLRRLEASEDSEFPDGERCLVDYVLRTLTNFPDLMKEFGPRRIGTDIARTVIAVRVLGAISAAYPIVRRECAKQLADFCMGSVSG